MPRLKRGFLLPEIQWLSYGMRHLRKRFHSVVSRPEAPLGVRIDQLVFKQHVECEKLLVT